MCQHHLPGGWWEQDNSVTVSKSFHHNILSFNDIIYQKYSRGTKPRRDYCNVTWYIFLFKAVNIFFISGFLWICEVPSSANRCDKIPVWSTAHTKASRHFFFLKVVPVKQVYSYGRKYFKSRKRATVHSQVIFSLKTNKNIGCCFYKNIGQ